MRPLDEHLRQVCEERAPAAESACALARRFLAPQLQARVLALQALFASLRGVPAGVSDPAVGLAKLAWWENELRAAPAGASRHPVVEALQRTGALEGSESELPGNYFTAVAARLDAPPFQSFDELDGWLCETYGAAGWELSTAQMDKLNAADDTKPPYPYDMLAGLTDRIRD